LERRAALIAPYNLVLRGLGSYDPKLKVLKRPDAFWTDWDVHKTGVYDPQSEAFQEDLCGQRDYLIQTRNTRSAGLKIPASDISVDSLTALVRSYLEQLEMIEHNNDFTVVLISGHWGEYGIFRDLDVETIYLIRDPLNALISHSKDIRHGKDYLKRGLENINTKKWIDNYLTGPHHYWINHAKIALSHRNSTIIRYNNFPEDWKAVNELPDISSEFLYKENNLEKILTKESIDYIHEKTKKICNILEFQSLY
jgi:hypothetical protein